MPLLSEGGERTWAHPWIWLSQAELPVSAGLLQGTSEGARGSGASLGLGQGDGVSRVDEDAASVAALKV